MPYVACKRDDHGDDGDSEAVEGVSDESDRKVPGSSLLHHPVEDFEEKAFLLIVQLLLTFLRNLLVHFFLPTEEFDHTDNVQDLSDDLHT